MDSGVVVNAEGGMAPRQEQLDALLGDELGHRDDPLGVRDVGENPFVEERREDGRLFGAARRAESSAL